MRKMPTSQHTITAKKNQDLYNSSVAIMLREMQREVNMGLPFGHKLRIDYSTNNHPTQLHAASDIDCCFMAILSWRKPARPRIMRKLSSNLMPGLSMNSREQIAELLGQTPDKKGKSTEDISRERGVEIQLRVEAQRRDAFGFSGNFLLNGSAQGSRGKSNVALLTALGVAF